MKIQPKKEIKQTVTPKGKANLQKIEREREREREREKTLKRREERIERAIALQRGMNIRVTD